MSEVDYDAIRGGAQILTDNDTTWGKVPYQVVLGKQFTTLKESLAFTHNTWGGFTKTGSPKTTRVGDLPGSYTPPEWGSIVDAVGANPAIYDSPNRIFYQDTRLGANDAINCFYQFNRDDDIVHPSMYSEPSGCYGLGRVYNNTTQRNQTIAYFSFGIPLYTDVVTFLKSAVYDPLARVNAAGFDRKGMFSLGSLFGAVGVLAFSVVFIPIRMFKAASNWLRTSKVSKYIEFRSEMSAYYAYADSICAQWLVATGMYGNGAMEGATSQANDAKDEGWFSSVISKIVPGWKASPSSLPPAMSTAGPSIFSILNLKARIIGMHALGGKFKYVQDVMNARTKPINNKDPYIENADEWASWSGETIVPEDTGNNGWLDQAFNTAKSTATGLTQFIGFRIEKSTDSSESFSNSTSPSKLGDMINNQIRSAYEKVTLAQGTEANSTFTNSDDGLGGISEMIRGIANGAQEALASLPGGIGDAVSAGVTQIRTRALVDLPDEYASSEYNKSFSISFQLRSPYGDITSIYQNIIVPLSLILAGSIPRAAGEHSYQCPFMLRAYCAGRFSIPLGIIESLSLTRGSSDFGWTYQNLPTCIDVSVTIKDLAPAIYMSLKGSGLADVLVGDDSSFTEYVNTLAGVGLAERVNHVLQAQRRVQLLSHTVRNKYLNPGYYGNAAGSSVVGQFVGLFISDNTIPRG